jgi:cysteinyl-tRNA synthetase
VAKSNLPNQDKLDLVFDFDRVLGLELEKASVEEEELQLPPKIKELVSKREELRKQGSWGQADELRKQAEKLGWKIEDTPTGPRVKRFN